jgi:transcriptional regulator
MYLPAHFAESRPEVLHAALLAHPLGLLITHGSDGLAANSVPFMLDAARGPHGTLIAHVARANPVWRHAAGTEVLVVFQGPQAYISPGWYATKAATGKVVPTWNYVMVQARGRLRTIEDGAALHALVSRLTDTHEAAQRRPWAVGDAPADYIEAMLKAIVGIEIELIALTGKWKVSQNRPAADREGVAAGLADLGGHDALAMRQQVQEPGRSES